MDATELLSDLLAQREKAHRKRARLEQATVELAERERKLDATIETTRAWLKSKGVDLTGPTLQTKGLSPLQPIPVKAWRGKEIRWVIAKAACDSIGKREVTLQEIAREMSRIRPGFDVRPRFLSRDFKRKLDLWERVGEGVYHCKWIAPAPVAAPWPFPEVADPFPLPLPDGAKDFQPPSDVQSTPPFPDEDDIPF